MNVGALLTVVSQPSNNLVGLNHVYVNANQFPSNNSNGIFFVQIKNVVLSAHVHDKVALNCIALNKVQRMTCHVSENTQIAVQVFSMPDKNFTIGAMSLGTTICKNVICFF